MPPAPTTTPSPALGVVVIAASAGGLKALGVVLASLPADLPAAVVVVLHIAADHKSLLAEILGRSTPLRVKEAEDGDALAAGVVYTAPPGRHVLVQPGGRLALSAGPKVRHVRPAAEPLFTSAAACYGRRVAAVVLTGGDSDGSAGVLAVKQAGGTVIAQDPATAEVPSMPRSAIETGGAVDLVLGLDGIAPALVEVVRAWKADEGPA